VEQVIKSIKIDGVMSKGEIFQGKAGDWLLIDDRVC
jgi:hypothetical protein